MAQKPLPTPEMREYSSPRVQLKSFEEKASSQLATLLDQGLVWRSANTGSSPSTHKRNAQEFIARFDLPELDNALPCGGLAFGCLHQWSLTHALTSKGQHRWHAPLFLLSALLGRSLGSMPYSANPVARGKSIVVWVGQRCWPTPQILEQTITWQSEVASGGEVSWPWKARTVFINPQSKASRLWSIAQALKNPAVFAVVADCSGFDLNAMRRLQLAAEFGNTLGLMCRPPWEQDLPSAAHTKWRVSPQPSKDRHLMWNLELLVAKGVATMPHQLSKRLSEVLSHKKTADDLESRQDARSLAASSVCSSEVPMKNQMQWFIEWNEETHHGKGSLRFAPQYQSSTDEDSTEQHWFAEKHCFAEKHWFAEKHTREGPGVASSYAGRVRSKTA